MIFDEGPFSDARHSPYLPPGVPLCAICRHEVGTMWVQEDAQDYVLMVTVECHGARQAIRIRMVDLFSGKPGVARWGLAFDRKALQVEGYLLTADGYPYKPDPLAPKVEPIRLNSAK